MKTFDYKGFDQTGRPVRGLIEAVDSRQAREKLVARGVLAERISGAGQRKGGLRLSAASRDIFYHEIGTLLNAGLPLTRVLDVLIESPELEGLAPLLAGVRDGIKEGGSLSDALAAASPRISPFELSVIDAGEQSGALASVCLRLADFYKRRNRAFEGVRTALIYPVVVLLAAFVVATVMLGFMLSKFEDVWIEAGIELPPITTFVLALGKYGAYAIPILAVAAWGAFVYLRRLNRESPAFRKRWQGRIFGLPIYGRVYTTLCNLRFTSTLALLLNGGVQLAEAVAIAGRATGNLWLETLVEEKTGEIRHGASLSDTLRRIPPLAGSLPGWVKAGEESGEMARMLTRADERFELQFDQSLERSLRILEPLLLLVVGGIVFVIALAILLPVLTLNKGI